MPLSLEPKQQLVTSRVGVRLALRIPQPRATLTTVGQVQQQHHRRAATFSVQASAAAQPAVSKRYVSLGSFVMSEGLKFGCRLIRNVPFCRSQAATMTSQIGLVGLAVMGQVGSSVLLLE